MDKRHVIPISLTLLNKFRNFQHESHSFKAKYLEEVNDLSLALLKSLNPNLKIRNYSIEKIILTFHYYLALIDNINTFFAIFDPSILIDPLNVQGFNSTNIFNVHSLTKALEAYRTSKHTEEVVPQEPKLFKGFSFFITDLEKAQAIRHGKTPLTSQRYQIELALNSRGKFDLSFVSIMSTELNRAFTLNLRSILMNSDKLFDFTIDFNDSGLKILEKFKTLKYTQSDFEKHMKLFTQEKDKKTLLNAITDLEDVVYYGIFCQDKPTMDAMERLFIALLGHRLPEIREKSVQLLNTLYDGVDWQLRGVYKGRIACVGEAFKLEYLIEAEKDDSNVAILVNGLSFDGNDEDNLISWHKPEIIPLNEDKAQPFTIISLDLGTFSRAGIYDWKIIRLQKGGKVASVYTANMQNADMLKSTDNLSELSLSPNESKEKEVDFLHTKVIHGRFIVHPKFTRDLQLHEIFAQSPAGIPGEFHKGSFAKLRETIPDYIKSGVNCVYLCGVAETDYKLEEDPKTKKKIPKSKSSNPLANTCRKSINTILGGSDEFKKFVKTAKEKKLRVIIDCLQRVSSVHPNKRYKEFFLQSIDDDSKLVTFYGGEGYSINYEDTAYLNFRKKEAWDLLINEIKDLVQSYEIDGINIEDAQSWPQIFEVDNEELERKDTDGSNAYELEDHFFGNIVKPKSVSGYWATDIKQKWANPILIRMCRTLWQYNPECIIIGECPGGQGYENRETQLMKSGLIPRLYKIPPAVSAIYGQHLHRDGNISSCEKLSINSLRSWYEGARKLWPSGAIAIQSSTSHVWPYPAFLFKKGAWSYIDLLFFLPDIPITFMAEMDGHGFRCRTLRHFQTQLDKGSKKTQSRENLLMAAFEAEDTYFEVGKLKVGQNITEKNRAEEFWPAQEQLCKDLGPEYGFDLKKIYLHYEHRRQLRNKLPTLRNGKLVPLLAEHGQGFHTHVLAFARVSERDMAIIATNFNEFNVFFSINTKNLKYVFDELGQEMLEHCVVKIHDYLGNAFDEHYTVYEFLYGRIDTSLKPHSSLVWGASIIPGSKELYEKTLMSSMERIKNKIARNQIIEGNEVAAMLTNVVKDVNSVQEFADNIGFLTKEFLKPNGISLPQMFNSIKDFKEDPSLSAKLFAFSQILHEKRPNADKEVKKEEESPAALTFSKKKTTSVIVSGISSSQSTADENFIAKRKFSDFTTPVEVKEVREENEMRTIFDYVKEILEYNRLGPIAFLTPELGRWSTAGGLGVMVDELSIGLAELGEEVICISPYYERNRKGETGYLEKDPDDIRHIFNMEVLLGDGKYIVGVHYGKVKGVHVYFIHQPFVFPRSYADGDARFTIQQLALMAKASLEIFCVIQKIPSLIITNDWFTALVPAYPKHGHFGDVFKGTKFLHIVHNLDPSYEGRLYPNPHEGFLEYVHNLPSYLFVDPYWKDRVMNPSRCAILSSDQWATVSQSYKQELLDTSPLASILKNHPAPFAFPNGIPKETRLKRIIDVCNNDHCKAKEKLQQKYFKLSSLNDDIAVYAFVGRITQQKGVHLILESAETLIRKFDGKVQIIVGGMVNMKEPYGSYCAGMMYDLNNRFPQNFWSSPNEFFTDGVLLNVGADYGLMPSLFEPGGIVQHEFFVGSTPVIAFETGGLKDTVFEFDAQMEKGNGFNFKDHKVGDFIYAMERSFNLFKNKEKYKVLRRNAFESTIDGADVSRAWNKEFHRLFNKTFIDPVLMKTHLDRIEKSFDEKKYKEQFTLKKIVPEASIEMKKLKHIHHRNHYLKSINLKNTLFVYKTNKLPRPKSVMLIGSFNDWKEPLPMNYDHVLGRWTVTVQLHPGEYNYKFIEDEKWLCSDDDPKINDLQGNINNYIRVL